MCLGFGTAAAGTMQCGTHLIEDGQVPGQSRLEIRQKCGAPENGDGDNVYYTRGNVSYRLHFNDNDELESITTEQK